MGSRDVCHGSYVSGGRVLVALADLEEEAAEAFAIGLTFFAVGVAVVCCEVPIICMHFQLLFKYFDVSFCIL